MAQVDIFVEQLHPKRTGRFLSLKVTEGNVLEVIVLVSIASGSWEILSHHLEGLRTYTPLKTNVSPENQWLEDVFPTEIVPFWGTC